MKKTVLLSALLCLSIVLAYSQTTDLNTNWQFQRLTDKTTNQAKIANQGSDWSSQYDVTVVAQSADLEVSRDTLAAEFDKLASGKWLSVELPHTAFVEPFTVLHQWQGICYYKREIEAPEKANGKIYLEMGAAMQLADVWVDGVHVTQHAGGYLPFVIDLSGKFDGKKYVEVLVRLDNRDNPLIPPGKPVSKLDFSYFSGLHRGARLTVKSEVYITDPLVANVVAGGGIFVTYPEVSQDRAIVKVKTHVANDSKTIRNFIVHQYIYAIDGLWGQGEKGECVAQSSSHMLLCAKSAIHDTQNITIRKPALWSPDAPNLYILESYLVENGKVIDREVTRIGIRRIEMTKKGGFVLNGEPIRLVGSNRHSDYPYLGNATSQRAGYRDIRMIKESGFNTVRLGHYPMDRAVLDACDELGVLAIEPIPGWQFFNKAPEFTARTYHDIRTLIRRDRNHPSIIMWETTLNESWPPNEWKDGAVRTAHEEFSGDQMFTSGDAYNYYGFDVSYNDWQEGFNRPNPSPNPSFIREHYDFEFGGHTSSTRIGRKDGEKALLQNAWNAQWSHNRYRAYYPWTMGDAVWSMFDYNRGCADNVCQSGVADLMRLPKFAVPFFRSQIKMGTPMPEGAMGPYIFIASHWTPRSAEDGKIVVFGNVEEVELLINGKSVARQKGDSGPDSDYSKDSKGWYTGGNPYDGGNCRNLTSPPFTFRDIEWTAGTIEAIGYVGGKVATRQKISTPGKASRLEIEYFESGRPIGYGDVAILYVKTLDSNGTLCVDQTTEITLESNHQIIGPETISSEGGIASFIVKTPLNAKNLDVRATSTIGKAKSSIKLQ